MPLYLNSAPIFSGIEEVNHHVLLYQEECVTVIGSQNSCGLLSGVHTLGHSLDVPFHRCWDRAYVVLGLIPQTCSVGTWPVVWRTWCWEGPPGREVLGRGPRLPGSGTGTLPRWCRLTRCFLQWCLRPRGPLL